MREHTRENLITLSVLLFCSLFFGIRSARELRNIDKRTKEATPQKLAQIRAEIELEQSTENKIRELVLLEIQK